MIHKGKTQSQIDNEKLKHELELELSSLVADCETISTKIVRPLVAIQTQTQTDEDIKYFTDYNNKLISNRARISEIKSQLSNL